jgi:hypothetical protein
MTHGLTQQTPQSPQPVGRTMILSHRPPFPPPPPCGYDLGMSDERKRAGVWPWVVVLVVGLLVLYVASFGPVCWLADREIISSVEAWRPLAWLAARCPDQVMGLYSGYSELFTPKSVIVPTGRALIIEEDLVHRHSRIIQSAKIEWLP